MMKHIELERNWEYIYKNIFGDIFITNKILSENELTEKNLEFVRSRQVHSGK